MKVLSLANDQGKCKLKPDSIFHASDWHKLISLKTSTAGEEMGKWKFLLGG